jgi:hypothetical protein
VSGRGSTFWLCGLSVTDSRYARYPRLPVTDCAGFTPATRETDDDRGVPPEGSAPDAST